VRFHNLRLRLRFLHLTALSRQNQITVRQQPRLSLCMQRLQRLQRLQHPLRPLMVRQWLLRLRLILLQLMVRQPPCRLSRLKKRNLRCMTA
jgi:hypothetical protein